MTKDELLANCGEWLSAVAASASSSDHVSCTAEKLVDACFDLQGDDNASTVEALPFYNASDREITYFPLGLLRQLYASNGFAAGNSMEEALVQGFSEIVERHAQLTFLKRKLVPPTIPDDYLQKFPTAYKTLTDIRLAGYDAFVKDCSLGEGYPVIASVVIDRRTHAYEVHVGSSPVFEIALQRSLTEMFQGRSIDDVADIPSLCLEKEGKRKPMDLRFALRYGSGSYFPEFFDDDPSYPFVPFPDMNGKTNADLLKFVLEYLKKRNRKMLVRDMSHYGFHTYQIIVPGMSENYYFDFTSSLPVCKMIGHTRDAEKDLLAASPDLLLELQLLFKHKRAFYGALPTFTELTRIPIGMDHNYELYLTRLYLAYLDWECGNRALALKHANTACSLARGEDASYLSCLCQTHRFVEAGYTTTEAINKLSKFYPEETISALTQTLTQNRNPFARFIIRCAPDACPACRYRETCQMAARKHLIALLNIALEKFDNKAAFDTMHQRFEAIDKNETRS